MMAIPKKAMVKFNGGRGALLCNVCNTIIRKDFDPVTIEDREHYCKKHSVGPDFEFDNTQMSGFYVTDPQHGGKVTCEECCGYIDEKDHVGILDHQHPWDFPAIHFHKKCYEERHDDVIDPPLTREELENARDYARRINTELRTFDAHLKHDDGKTYDGT